MSKFPLLDVIVHNTVRSLYFVTAVLAPFLCEKFWLIYLMIKTIQLIPLQNLISSQPLFILQKWSLAYNLAYLSHFFIKFKDQGQFWSLLA